VSYRYPLGPDYRDIFRADFPAELEEAPGTVRWFGPPWPSPTRPAPVCRPDTHTATPVGERCRFCGEAFTEVDSGVSIPGLGGAPPWSHYGLRCWMRVIGLGDRGLTVGVDHHPHGG
jgi:hypothetical protein